MGCIRSGYKLFMGYVGRHLGSFRLLIHFHRLNADEIKGDFIDDLLVEFEVAPDFISCVKPDVQTDIFQKFQLPSFLDLSTRDLGR